MAHKLSIDSSLRPTGLLKVAELLKVKGLVEEERERLLNSKNVEQRSSRTAASSSGGGDHPDHHPDHPHTKLNGGDHHGHGPPTPQDYPGGRGRSSRQGDHRPEGHRSDQSLHRSQEREKDLHNRQQDAADMERHHQPRARTPASEINESRDRSSSRDNHR